MIELANDQLELFVDHRLIERLDNATLRMHEARPAGRALTFDRPWEGGGSFYLTVFQDGGRFRMYYRGWPLIMKDATQVQGAFTCYAESLDGIHWYRPRLGLHEVGGSRDNNVLLTGDDGTHAFGAFRDDNPKARDDQRYKALGIDHIKVDDKKRSVLGGYVSPDGIHWSRLQDEPVITKGAFDSLNVGFWSRHEQCYLSYYRTWSEASDPSQFKGGRAISRATSDDFINWSDPVTMEYGDAPFEEFYTNGTHPYFREPRLYVGMPKRFKPGRRKITEEQIEQLGLQPSQANGMSDTVLLTSRGGNRYERTFMEAIVRPGPDLGNWSARNNHVATGVIPTGPMEMSIFAVRHYAQPTCFLERLTFRTDGFASLHAGWHGGEMVTKPIRFDGDRLLLNMATSAAGAVRVEAQDGDGKAIEGYALDDCTPMIGDELEYEVTWGEGKGFAPLSGRAVRLRFVLNDADVYSLRVR